jgi:hypothetical protein
MRIGNAAPQWAAANDTPMSLLGIVWQELYQPCGHTCCVTRNPSLPPERLAIASYS